MKSDNRSSTLSLGGQSQIDAGLATSIAASLIIGIFFISLSIPSAVNAKQSAVSPSFVDIVSQTPKATATNTTAANTVGVISSNITLGAPQFLGTEYGKTISLKPAIVNGTPGSQAVIKGTAVLKGVNITINGNVFLPSSHGVIYSQGSGIWKARNGDDGMANYTFLGIEHFGAAGKLSGTIFDTVKATGKLAFLNNTIVIDKHEVDKAGNIISKFWELK
jgi:hypothetical protein